MSKRTLAITVLAAIAAFSCFALTGCGIEDMDEESRKSLGFGLGIMILLASGLGYFISGQYFGRKRQRARRYRSRSNTKKKRR